MPLKIFICMLKLKVSLLRTEIHAVRSFFPDNLNLLKERGMREYFFFPWVQFCQKEGVRLGDLLKSIGKHMTRNYSRIWAGMCSCPGWGYDKHYSRHTSKGLLSPFRFGWLKDIHFCTANLWDKPMSSQLVCNLNCFYCFYKYLKNFTIIGFVLSVSMLI